MYPPPEHHHRHQPPPFTKLLSLQPNIISDYLQSTSSSILLKKAMSGFMAAAYVGLVLTTVMFVSVVIGVCLVNLWIEKPVYVEENLYFDYTDVNPYAVFDFGFGIGKYDGLVKSLPVGHLCNVRLVFVMPESDYNREIGNFQVVAESFSSNGDVIASSSHPCMLRFQSLPIRTMHAFLMGVPLVLGYTSEIQMVNVPLLKYKEHHYPRTQSIKISLVPRAGTPFVPQLYEARLIVTSELPWRKELVRNWKWTFYVWTSIYVYLMMLVVLIYCFRSVMFRTMTTVFYYQRVAASDVLTEEPPRMVGGRDRPTTSGPLKRWRQGRSKRKAMFLGGEVPETNVESEATSMSVTRDEDPSVTTEEVGDSESICQ